MVDFSEVIIAQMKERHPEMVWQVMDVREMKYGDNEFDLAIDKVRLSPSLLWFRNVDSKLSVYVNVGHTRRHALRLAMGSRGRGEGEYDAVYRRGKATDC